MKFQNKMPIAQIESEREQKAISPELTDAYLAIAMQQEIIDTQQQQLADMQDQIKNLQIEIQTMKGGN